MPLQTQVPYHSNPKSTAWERPVFFAPRALSTCPSMPISYPPTILSPSKQLSSPIGGRENSLSPIGKLLLGLAVGGLVYHILDSLSAPSRRPHLEAWKRGYVFDRDGGHCIYCGVRVTWTNHHIDHKIALACGGSNEVRNLALSCKPCNLSKGTLSAREFRRYLSYFNPRT